MANQKIGMAIPGPFDYAKGISLIKDNAKFESLYGRNIKQLLSASVGINEADIYMLNDAAAFLKGEIFAGAAKGFSSAIGLALGTGLGTTKCHSDKVDDANLWCSPFRDSIAEDYISTRWFVKRFNQLTHGNVECVKQIAEIYYENDNAQLVFREFSVSLADFLIPFIQTEKPEIVVIGGNIMNSEEFFLPLVKKRLAASGINIPVMHANLGEDAAILGAAAAVEMNTSKKSQSFF